MNLSGALAILLFAFTSCDRSQKRISGRETACEKHHQVLKKSSGFVPDASSLVDPGYGVAEFNIQFGDRYPHIRPWFFSTKRKHGWNNVTEIQVCDECQRAYSKDFADYLKIDEKERWRQFMDFSENHPSSEPTVENPASADGNSNLKPEKLVPP